MDVNDDALVGRRGTEGDQIGTFTPGKQQWKNDASASPQRARHGAPTCQTGPAGAGAEGTGAAFDRASDPPPLSKGGVQSCVTREAISALPWLQVFQVFRNGLTS